MTEFKAYFPMFIRDWLSSDARAKFTLPQRAIYLELIGLAHPTMRAKAVKTGWNSLRRRASVQCRLHDLRHTFATRLAANGVPESTMLNIMGHMSRAMLERYSHIRIAAKREAVANLTLTP